MIVTDLPFSFNQPGTMPRTLFLFLFVFNCLKVSAQNSFEGIPPVSLADFSPVSNMVNSETEAVILLDSGASTLDANPQDGFFINYYKFRRILILKKSALDDLSRFSVTYSASMNGGKKLKTLQAYAYNIENGKINRTALQESDFFAVESPGDLKTVKFTFPGVKEGSIVEYAYSERWPSPILQDWYFQGTYPKLKSVYTVSLPDMFNFTIQFQNRNYQTNTKKTQTLKNVYSQSFEYENSIVNTISWIYENIPAMREEPFTSTVENYLASVKFQISARPYQPGVTLGVLRDWQALSNELLNSAYFGTPLRDPSSFIKKQAKFFAEDKNTDLQKAQAIYTGVRDHFKVTGRGIFISDNLTLTDIYKSGTGEVGEINLLLTAMLRSQKIQADPVILATRDKGLTNQKYPLVDNFNYLICRVVVDGKPYYLDASDPIMGFGKIPTNCYNGHARVITKENFPVFLAPDSLTESLETRVTVHGDKDSKYLTLEWKEIPGYYTSSDIRRKLNEKKTDVFFKTLTDNVPFKKTLDSFSIDNLTNLDGPVSLSAKMSLDMGTDSRIYLNPLLGFGLTENPFKSAQRLYPVEMSYVSNESYVLNMELPKDYEIEEIPKSQKLQLNETDGSYEYKIVAEGNKIQVSSIMILKRAIFEPEDYESLKTFYSFIIKKQSEMIVLKRKT